MLNVLYHLGLAMAHVFTEGDGTRWTQEYEQELSRVVRVTVETVDKEPYIVTDVLVMDAELHGKTK